MGVGVGLDSLLISCIGMVFAGVGIGAVMSPITTVALSPAPADRRWQASGVVSTCRQLGGIVGVAVFGACIAAAPRHPGSAVVPGVVVGFAVCAVVMLGAVVAGRGLPRR